MIRFKQLETGTPKDIEVSTDDANAEMAGLMEMLDEVDWSDGPFRESFDGAKRNDAGELVFVIPGDEAGDLADIWNELAEFLEARNREVIETAESTLDA